MKFLPTNFDPCRNLNSTRIEHALFTITRDSRSKPVMIFNVVCYWNCCCFRKWIKAFNEDTHQSDFAHHMCTQHVVSTPPGVAFFVVAFIQGMNVTFKLKWIVYFFLFEDCCLHFSIVFFFSFSCLYVFSQFVPEYINGGFSFSYKLCYAFNLNLFTSMLIVLT